jgi:hypothetical protein
MANKQLMLPANRLLTNTNRVASGGTAALYVTGTTTPAEFLDSDGTTLGHILTADGIGQLPNAWQDEETPFRLVLKDRSGGTLDGGDIDPYYFGRIIASEVSVTANTAATRTDLAGVDAEAGMAINLAEAGREGLFVFDESDLSAKVTNDTRQAVYVPPSSDTTGASGAWVRKFNGPMNIEWFGAVADFNGTTGTDNLAAILAATKFGTLTGTTSFTPIMQFGRGRYYISSTLEIEHVVNWTGHDTGTDTDGVVGLNGTSIVSPADTATIRIHQSNTYANTTKSGNGNLSATGSIITGICAEQKTLGTDTAAHGFQLRTAATLRFCSVRNAAGNGFHIVASSGGGGAIEGNANEWRLEFCTVYSCGFHGLRVQYPDANAGTCIGFKTKSCGGCGILDIQTFGNTYIAPQISGYGNGGVHYGGRLYQLVAAPELGGEAIGSTTEPGTNANIWHDIGAGSPSTQFPTWVSGTTYHYQTPIMALGDSTNSIFLGVYVEGGNLTSRINGPAISIGGISSGSEYSVRIKGQVNTGYVVANSGIGMSKTSVAGTALATHMGTLAETIIGTFSTDLSADGTPDILRHLRSADSATAMTWKWDHTNNNQILAYGSNKPLWFITGQTTAYTFGRDAGVPNMFGLPDFALMDSTNYSNSRIIAMRDAVPSSGYHAKGEIVFYCNASAGGKIGWVCTASGTPGTWKQWGVIDA